MTSKIDHVGLKFRWRLWRLGMETKPEKKALASVLVVTALFVLMSSAAAAKPVSGISLDASQWTVFNRTEVATGYSADKAMQGSDGPLFAFPSADSGLFTSLMMAHISGNLTGKTITAQIRVVQGSGAAFVFNPHLNTGPTPPTVRLVFWTTVGPFNLESYWWSNGVGYQVLADGSSTLTALVTPGQWSSLDGQMGTVVLDDFAFAAANAKQLGVSFGGGSFFLNGVNVSGGSATFELVSITIG